jgi:hypothetical protein
MPLQATSGAASYDAFGGGVPAAPPTYIEDVFSCFLYTGNGTTNTITNGIDLSTKGGLVWMKSRSNAFYHGLYDTVRGTGTGTSLYSNTTEAQGTNSTNQNLTAFNTTGFTLGATSSTNVINGSGDSLASWTFREQAKFFDVVTYTGASGNAVQNIAHNLGSTPAVIIVKCTDQAGYNWVVYHRSLGATQYVYLNLTNAAATSSNFWNNTAPTSTQFTVGTSGSVNGDSQQYVAYLFAHDAGGFGLTGTDNVISCGSYVGDGGAGTTSINLGYEPQWVLVKDISGTDNWVLIDNMRGFANESNTANDARLQPNTSNAESLIGALDPTATGFKTTLYSNINTSGRTYIYVAIRRGPMKVPTTGTSVFAPVTGNFSSPYTVTTNFPVDLTISSRTAGATRAVNDRLRGGTTNSYVYLNTATTAAESTGTGAGLGFDNNTAVIDVNWQTGGNALWWNFRRAPSFFDEVCYTGTGSALTVSHNLQAVPELIIGKNRTTAGNNWPVLFNFASTTMNYGFLNLTNSCPNDTYANVGVFSAAPTSTSMFLISSGSMNTSANNHVAYLFATCAGVSKVGSYTGTGATQTINCGFGAGGARFALIKRTDSTGDWWVWDSARGMVSGTDPRIDLNAGNPQTNANWVYTISTGFQIVTTDASVNASGGTYIFFAVS